MPGLERGPTVGNPHGAMGRKEGRKEINRKNGVCSTLITSTMLHSYKYWYHRNVIMLYGTATFTYKGVEETISGPANSSETIKRLLERFARATISMKILIRLFTPTSQLLLYI